MNNEMVWHQQTGEREREREHVTKKRLTRMGNTRMEKRERETPLYFHSNIHIHTQTYSNTTWK